jgi:peptidyl-dipeptidase Dcp
MALKPKRFSAQFDQASRPEYLGFAIDMEWHTFSHRAPDPAALERVALACACPANCAPRSTYFQHIFAGGYSAGYYSYIWAEVLDADAFQAFKEKGLFDPETARSFRVNILEKGSSEEPMTLYKRFRGREPGVMPLPAGLLGSVSN